MSYGRRVDSVVGVMSRLLHVRGARENTVPDFAARYLDLSPEDLFPTPPPMRAARAP
jgi:hypothetical protein